ncbi:MAG: DUF362 domain-containing protein [Desulfocapsa sp.]|nr:DUF362 domain-containing protein [Desulfocapsa sp.]
MSRIPVCLDRCDSYDIQILQPKLQDQLDILNIPSDFSRKRVLLKPNLISAGVHPLACSNPLFVAAAASCFLDRGARVLLGDSPAFGSASHVLKQQGFMEALSGVAVEFVPFRARIMRTLACGIRVTIAAEALDCDFFVNLPRLKAHEQMGVTMAVKNIFGIVLGARKAWLHMRHGKSRQVFARMILNLQELLPSTLVLGDGIEVMHRRGPVRGDSLFLGCLAASKNCIALDRAMLDVLEIDKKRIPLAVAAENLSLPGSQIEDVEFPQLVPQAFSGSGFQIPATLSPIQFRPFRYLLSSLKRVVSG